MSATPPARARRAPKAARSDARAGAPSPSAVTANAKRLGAGSLADLASVKQRMRAQAMALAEHEAQARALELAARMERELFARTVGPVLPLRTAAQAPLPRPKPPPVPAQRDLDEQAAWRETWSDDFNVESLLDTDEALSYRRTGVGADVVRKLRRGVWAIQAQVDLHGLRREEARERLAAFLRDTQKQGLRCVRVVHGKGLGSPGKQAVLKGKVLTWLVQKTEVLAFAQARASEGGAGALVVLLGGARPPSST